MENYIVVRGTDVRGGARSALVLRYLEKCGGDGGALSRSHSRAGVRDADPREGQGALFGRGGAPRGCEEGERRGRAGARACGLPSLRRATREREGKNADGCWRRVDGVWWCGGGSPLLPEGCVACGRLCGLPSPSLWLACGGGAQVACCGDGLPARPPACLASPP